MGHKIGDKESLLQIFTSLLKTKVQRILFD